MYEGAEVSDVSEARPQPVASRQRLRTQFRKHAYRHRRQGGVGRHPAYRLYDRSAGAGHRQPGIRQAGGQVGHYLRARKCLAAQRRRACARHRRLSSDAARRRDRRRTGRCGRLQPRTRLRRLRRALAICIGANTAEADGQLCDQGRDGSRRHDTKSAPHTGQRRGTPHRRRYRAQLRPRLDARPIGRDLSRSSTAVPEPDHRGTRKDRGFRRKRSQPERHQVSSRSAASTPSWW